MRLLGYLLGACVVLAIARMAVLALAIALLLAVAAGMLARPKETLGLVLLMFAGCMIQSYPLLCLVIIGVAAIVSALARNREGPS